MGERKLFGTDGIRGKANVYPMTCEIAMNLGRAVTHYFQTASTKTGRPLIIVGKDTRKSCYMLEQAFSAGVCSQGGKVILTGPLPTPGVAFVIQSMRADAGVMISASHNHFGDNGIKIFDSKGYKLPDAVEFELEKMILNPTSIPVKLGAELGNAKRLDEVIGRYIVNVKSALDANCDFENMRVVLDCANGAAYKVAPMVFAELGAEVVSISVNPNGENINGGCGSLFPQKCQYHVKQYRADIGICLDGDADRLVVVDGAGDIIDGDVLIGLITKYMFDKQVLKKGDVIVGTVMSNLGLEHYIRSLGLEFHRTKVGDRYIMDFMKDSGAILGGEPSGHIILKQFSTTGDGILSALKVLEAVNFYKKTIKELTTQIKLYPQVLKNVIVANKPPFETVPQIQSKLREVEAQLMDKGRVILRYSGTEPLVRVMIEGEDAILVEKLCDELVKTVSVELQ